MIIPGVLNWDEYVKRRKLWDPIAQCVSLDAQFYVGPGSKLYPPEWLSLAHRIAEALVARRVPRKAKAIGIDVAEGGDDTVWSVTDELGVLYMEGEKTIDTAYIPKRTIALGREWNVPPENWFFDRGGGGQQHVDILREYNNMHARTIGFGDTPADMNAYRRQFTTTRSNKQREEDLENKYTFKNRRAEMYWLLRVLIDPVYQEWDGDHWIRGGFGIPRQYTKLIEQLRPAPIKYDKEGQIYLPPKNRGTGINKTSKVETMHDLIGCSPDWSDSLVMATWGMHQKPVKRVLTAS